MFISAYTRSSRTCRIEVAIFLFRVRRTKIFSTENHVYALSSTAKRNFRNALTILYRLSPFAWISKTSPILKLIPRSTKFNTRSHLDSGFVVGAIVFHVSLIISLIWNCNRHEQTRGSYTDRKLLHRELTVKGEWR